VAGRIECDQAAHFGVVAQDCGYVDVTLSQAGIAERIASAGSRGPCQVAASMNVVRAAVGSVTGLWAIVWSGLRVSDDGIPGI
jgi:hypothetical protein